MSPVSFSRSWLIAVPLLLAAAACGSDSSGGAASATGGAGGAGGADASTTGTGGAATNDSGTGGNAAGSSNKDGGAVTATGGNSGQARADGGYDTDASTSCAAASGTTCSTSGAAICKACRSNGTGWRECTCKSGEAGLTVDCVTHDEANADLGCTERVESDGGFSLDGFSFDFDAFDFDAFDRDAFSTRRDTGTGDLDSSAGCQATSGNSCTTEGAEVCKVCRSGGNGWRVCTCTSSGGSLAVSCVTHDEANTELGCSARTDGG